MDKLIWHKGLSVGVHELDYQHKIIFDIINRLVDNRGVFVSSEIIGDVLQEMREYSEEHFELEEKYMDLLAYSGREEHKKRHREFRNKVVELCFDVANHQHQTPEEIFRYLCEWWRDHILNEDQKYTETFAAYGLK